MIRLIYILAFGLYAVTSTAQVDPSAALLLRKSSPAPAKEIYDGGRYTIRPSETISSKEVIEPKSPASHGAVTPVKITPKTVTAPAVETAPPVSVEANDVKEQPQSMGTKVEKAILGVPPDEIDDYKDRLHAEDTRNNLMELELEPGFLYVDAQSNYWPRRYTFASPNLKVAAKIWISPFFGFETHFSNSLDGSISKLATSLDRIKAEQQWFSVGLRWRNFFGMSRRSESITFGIDYQEYQLVIPSDVTSRNKNKTVGIKLLLEMNVPKNQNFSLFYGAAFIPRADHNEFGTAATFTSGGQDSTTVLSGWVGGVNTFNRHNQIFWKLEHSIEKSQFEGAATAADPLTGTAPEGVGVTTGFTSISLGYRWGY